MAELVSNQQGESEIKVSWPEFSTWYSTGGEVLPAPLVGRGGDSYVRIVYTYSYDPDSKQVGDINPVQLDDRESNQTLAIKYLMSAFAEYYEEQIKSDIKTGEDNIAPTPHFEEYNYEDQIGL